MILLNNTPSKGVPITIKATTSNSVTDTSGNAATFTEVTVVPNY